MRIVLAQPALQAVRHYTGSVEFESHLALPRWLKQAGVQAVPFAARIEPQASTGDAKAPGNHSRVRAAAPLSFNKTRIVFTATATATATAGLAQQAHYV